MSSKMSRVDSEVSPVSSAAPQAGWQNTSHSTVTTSHTVESGAERALD
jgi:hypothetical protein